MAKAKKHSIILNKKEYTMPSKITPDAYLNYLELRDSIMATENKSGMYTAEQFRGMITCIIELYGNQFTKEELMDMETGLSVPDIIMEFASIELGVGEAANEKLEKIQENFTSGK